ncbi:MAG: hypothetical protein QF473_09620 [Planctomycetota bacterium]|jgi:hypothetical protein|nr:hypothetical protein [Planctomycetota bacterium]
MLDAGYWLLDVDGGLIRKRPPYQQAKTDATTTPASDTRYLIQDAR